jgi:hypothetical protein
VRCSYVKQLIVVWVFPIYFHLITDVWPSQMLFGDIFILGTDDGIDELSLTWAVEFCDNLELTGTEQAVTHIRSVEESFQRC